MGSPAIAALWDLGWCAVKIGKVIDVKSAYSISTRLEQQTRFLQAIAKTYEAHTLIVGNGSHRVTLNPQ